MDITVPLKQPVPAVKTAWQIYWHLFFWLCIISLYIFMAHYGNPGFGLKQLLVLCLLFPAINISLFYLNLRVYIPLFLDKKKYGIYAAVLVATIAAYGIGRYGVALLFSDVVLAHKSGQVTGFFAFFIGSLLIGLMFVFMSVLYRFTVDWFLNDRIKRDLENQRLSAELAFLKSQINPHFLFNSLNSIYSLAYQRSETTPEAILKLSEIMRYMLYECNDNRVALSKELKYLNNYIDLQKIRFGSKAYIDFKIVGDVSNQQIVPLLLIAFIENAFKHGVVNDISSPIKILINVGGGKLHFYVHNKKHTHNHDAESGIGLNNVRRRLNLLYPGKYTLDIKDENFMYTSELSITL